ncbi:putative N-acetyltransferase [Neolecta irregularis DAH-3]|uniref:Putative N-acetyltransferase n=1 Tax=Neolecta irregularis (strain DAH-3) TaxID=1198029 RepID=A0A1U7LK55_NEOID|nr:putative N-acetyltransferase [Neolecta irregularis DAH-3]|eukprot:OLL23046.1 putative N-acetyltransferase [Neolecta irregularis DAH-3]
MQPQRVSFCDCSRAAATLAAAFNDDPASRYLFGHPHISTSEETFRKLHADFMEYTVYAHLLHGQVWQIDDFAGVSLWMPPGKSTDSLTTLFMSGYWRLYYKLSRKGRIRLFDEFFPLLFATKKLILGDYDQNSWYLVYLGTLPSARGKGYARKLIECASRQADAAGVPCYLESSHPQNRNIYERFDFVYRDTIYLQGDVEGPKATGSGHPLELMSTNPKSALDLNRESKI